MTDEGVTDTREMTPLGHEGPAPYGVRYRWTDAEGALAEAQGDRSFTRFFVSEAERDRWLAPRQELIEILAWCNPPGYYPGDGNQGRPE